MESHENQLMFKMLTTAKQLKKKCFLMLAVMVQNVILQFGGFPQFFIELLLY